MGKKDEVPPRFYPRRDLQEMNDSRATAPAPPSPRRNIVQLTIGSRRDDIDAIARVLARRHPSVPHCWWEDGCRAGESVAGRVEFGLGDPALATRLRHELRRVATCAGRVLVHRCKECAAPAKAIPVGCSSRICPEGEARRPATLRPRVADGVAALREAAAKLPGWRVVSLTLAPPHSGDLRLHVQRCRRARAPIPRLLGEHVERDLDLDSQSVEVLSPVEVAAGGDGDGRARLHVVAFLPDGIDPVVLRHMAGRGLFGALEPEEGTPQRALGTLLDDEVGGDEKRRERLGRRLAARRGPCGRRLHRACVVDFDRPDADGRVALDPVEIAGAGQPSDDGGER